MTIQQALLGYVEGGIRSYAETLAAQEWLVRERQAGRVSDTLLLCEHPPTYTCGIRADVSDVAHIDDVPAYQVRRGGGVTYHGLGQLVGYPVIDLRARRWKAGEYLLALEDVLIETLRDMGVLGQRHDNTRGVWVGDRKIASIGVQVSQGIAWHGFALNVSCDLTPFTRTVMCCEPMAQMTSLAQVLHQPLAMSHVQHTILRYVAQRCNYDLQEHAWNNVIPNGFVFASPRQVNSLRPGASSGNIA